MTATNSFGTVVRSDVRRFINLEDLVHAYREISRTHEDFAPSAAENGGSEHYALGTAYRRASREINAVLGSFVTEGSLHNALLDANDALRREDHALALTDKQARLLAKHLLPVIGIVLGNHVADDD